MDFHPRIKEHLDALTDGLDGTGNDLHTILLVLVDDLRAAVPSFLGLTVAIRTAGGDPITLSTLTIETARRVRASLSMTVSPPTSAPSRSMVYYAATPRAFDAMADDLRDTLDIGGTVVTDQHLRPSNRPGITGLDRLTTISQAIGILIDRGFTLDQAHLELGRLATSHQQSEYRAATHLIEEISARQHT